jgi:hypothetical protein
MVKEKNMMKENNWCSLDSLITIKEMEKAQNILEQK